MISRKLVLACCVLLLSTRAMAVSVIVVGNGGNLSAAIAAANHQDIIEIQSNGTFVGNLTWSNKYLTVRAGAGFQPTIQGSITAVHGSNSVTGGTFQGLNVTGSLYALATGTTYATYLVENCKLQDGSTLSGTGNFHVKATFNNTDFPGIVNFGGTGGFILDATINRSSLRNYVYLNTLASENVLTVHFNDNDIFKRTYTGGGLATDHRDLTFARNRFREGITLTVGEFNNLSVRMTENVLGDTLVPPLIEDAGIFLRSNSNAYAARIDASFINNTVVGFRKGVEFLNLTQPSRFNTELVNMLLRNTDDLLNVPASNISYSLVSDGTYSNQSKNFSGLPLLGPNGELLAGSPGIDGGNNSKASTSDFLGNIRIRDGNGDGISVVDVGAYEFMIPEPTTTTFACFALIIAARFRRPKR